MLSDSSSSNHYNREKIITGWQMGVDEALEFADGLVFTAIGAHFEDLTREIFRGAWDGQTYEQIAQALRYDESYVDTVGELFLHV